MALLLKDSKEYRSHENKDRKYIHLKLEFDFGMIEQLLVSSTPRPWLKSKPSARPHEQPAVSYNPF